MRSVTQRPDFSGSGQWDVVTINKNNEEEKHIFDAVLVCSGHYTHPALPLSDFHGNQKNQLDWFKTKDEIISFALSCAVMIYFPGHETFFGRLLHSWEYKDADSFKGKRVVVVGIGNSGGDVAVEISRSAEKVSK